MKKSGLVYIILASILWGTSGIFVNNLAPYGVTSIQMTFIRGLVAFVCMGVFVLISDRGIVKTNFISKYIVNDVIDWNLTDNTLAGTDKKPNDDQVNFALTLVVGGDAVDTLVYLAK